MAKQKLFYFQAYDQRQQWQKGSLVAQSKQAAQFQLIQLRRQATDAIPIACSYLAKCAMHFLMEWQS